jgi:D-psicose/D-tagatose/L-ribulose 3-epimerase
MKRTNPIGIISMFYARPFGPEHLKLLARVKASGCDFIELLVPEPGELDLKETKAALKDHGLGVVLAARVNLSRDLASADAAAAKAGVTYLESCIEIAALWRAPRLRGPAAVTRQRGRAQAAHRSDR